MGDSEYRIGNHIAVQVFRYGYNLVLIKYLSMRLKSDGIRDDCIVSEGMRIVFSETR